MIVSLVKPHRIEMFPMNDTNDLVLRAMRLAEKAHRTREAGSHFRKGPGSVDKPSYFLHLTEVAWMLQDAGYAASVVAAGYLHDGTLKIYGMRRKTCSPCPVRTRPPT